MLVKLWMLSSKTLSGDELRAKKVIAYSRHVDMDLTGPLSTNDINHCTESICMGLATKNLQSIRSTERFMDFIVEIDKSDFDTIFLSETWRHEVEKTILTPGGNKLFFAGGAGHGGVGLRISRELCCQVRELTFHAFSSRPCSLKFTIGKKNKKFMVLESYFPTTWMSHETVFEMHELLDLLLRTCVRGGRVPMFGSDFNA